MKDDILYLYQIKKLLDCIRWKPIPQIRVAGLDQCILFVFGKGKDPVIFHIVV